jgi:hypothetical protein
MSFGLIENSNNKYLYFLDTGTGYKPVRGAHTLTNPTRINGYIVERKIVNIFLNGTLSNAAFIIKYRQTRVEFEYNGDITKFTQPILLQLEIEK